MIYNIIGIFPTIDDANSAAKILQKAGFTKQFPGYAVNTKFQPESLVEDHFIDQNEISVYTPNINRAHKAKNILIKFGARLDKIKGIYFEKVEKRSPEDQSLKLLKRRKKLSENKIKEAHRTRLTKL